MDKHTLVILILLNLFLLSGCVTTKDTNLLQKTGYEIPAYPPEELMKEYKVRPGDQLLIIISVNPLDETTSQLLGLFSSLNTGRNANIDNSFSIAPDGTIYFPYLGDVYVSDKTTEEIQDLFTKRITENIAEDCLVKVSLNNRYFSVLGEAGTGRYRLLKEKTTIFQALSLSGDIKNYGDRGKVKILRQQNDETIIKTFDLRSEDIVNSEYYYVEPNDIIYVQPLGRQFFGINSFGALFTVFSTIVSFGLAIYSLVK